MQKPRGEEPIQGDSRCSRPSGVGDRETETETEEREKEKERASGGGREGGSRLTRMPGFSPVEHLQEGSCGQ